MIETASWPPKCATDSSGRRAQDTRPAPAASASPLPDQAIQSRPARPRGLRNSGPRARPPQPWRLDRQAFCDFLGSYADITSDRQKSRANLRVISALQIDDQRVREDA